MMVRTLVESGRVVVVQLRDFRYFRAVGEELSFSKAARRLHIASSPLSRHIAKLENDLGVKLFERTTRSVALTDAGKYLLQRITMLDGSLERAVFNAQRIHSGASGLVTVGYSGSATYDVVPRIIRRFKERFPAAEVDIIGAMGSQQQVAALGDGRLSVGFVRDLELPANIESARVFTEPLVLMLPADHPLNRETDLHVGDLRNEEIISFDRSTAVSQAVDGTCRRAGFEPRVTARATESFALACMVAAGLGVGLVPASAQHLKLDGLVYRDLPDSESESVHLNMVWAADMHAPLLDSFRAVALATTASD